MKKIRSELIYILSFLLFFLFSSCERYYSVSDFGKIEKIDAHVHANSIDPSFCKQAKDDNFKLITVNVDYPDFPPIEEQHRISVELKKQYPDQLAHATTFRMDGWDESDWQESVLEYLDSTFQRGAIAVKVWKNIGMDFRDKNNNLVMIDNPQFDIIFNHLSKVNIPLIGHQGEPRNCWLPIEEMTVLNDREYFKEHHQYHMFLHPEFPSYEEQLIARDRMLDKNENLRFIGAHLGSLEWSVDELANFLDKYPNAVVDLAERLGQVQYQSQRNRERVRQFFVDYQDRILYATDLTHEEDVVPSEFSKEAHETWIADWKFLTTDEMMTDPVVEGEFQGLKLPASTIIKIYRLNAEKSFPKAFVKD